MEACKQCEYVLHSWIRTIEGDQPHSGGDGVAIFRPAIGRRALCIRLEAILLVVSCTHMTFQGTYYSYSTAESPIKSLRNPQNEITIQSCASRSKRAPSATRSPF